MKKRVLALGGHPYDMEQFAGGTLVLLAKEGCEVLIARKPIEMQV